MRRDDEKETGRLLTTALILSIITVMYNLAEGGISAFFGMEDDTIALFGFGIDSFVEVLSGIGITHMVLRMRTSAVEKRDRFEKQALYITGISFYLLTAGLVIGAVLTVLSGSKPETTVVGIIISSVSIATMWFLYRYKLATGEKLGSEPIIADARCTKTCFYLSFVLLASSILYEVFAIAYIDTAGALGIAYFAFREGKESIEKAGSDSLSCSCDSGCCGGDKST